MCEKSEQKITKKVFSTVIFSYALSSVILFIKSQQIHKEKVDGGLNTHPYSHSQDNQKIDYNNRNVGWVVEGHRVPIARISCTSCDERKSKIISRHPAGSGRTLTKFSPQLLTFISCGCVPAHARVCVW